MYLDINKINRLNQENWREDFIFDKLNESKISDGPKKRYASLSQ
jgi:hypothetical protein